MSGSSWLEEVWEEREERIYPALFGELRGIFPIPPSRFARFDVAPDPRWLTIGVFECFPTEDRASWVYVTSGLSNPWDDETDPAEPSGYGCELAFESARRGDWAIGLLHHLASIQLLAISGRLDLPVLERGDRLALHGPIDGEASTLRNVLVTAPRWFPETLEQRSGVAEWLFCVGISDTEKAFAREHDNESLLNGLRGAGHASITDPDRASLVF